MTYSYTYATLGIHLKCVVGGGWGGGCYAASREAALQDAKHGSRQGFQSGEYARRFASWRRHDADRVPNQIGACVALCNCVTYG
eukprot:1178551-Pyramimonas_sp.AAC.1